MSLEAKNIYLCLYDYSNNSCKSLVTDSIEYALSLDQNPKLATIDDLNQHRAATGEVFQGLLNTYEGTVKWMEVEDAPDLSQYLIVK